MSDNMKKLGIFAAIAAAATGAAAFFLGTKKGQEMTKHAMTKVEAMVDEVAAKLEKLGKVSNEKFHEVVEESAKKWQETKSATAEEIADAKNRLERAWKEMNTESKPHGDHEGHKCDHC